MKLNDALLGGFFFALALAIGASALTMPRMSGTAIGAGTFPLIVAVMMAAGGLSLLVSGLRRWGAGPVAALPDWLSERPGQTRAAAAIAFVIIYALLGKSLGFPLLVPPLMILLLWLTTRRPLAAVVLGLAISAAVWMLFASVLKVPLPLGLLERVIY
jgi:putative tricarboxylic transport membrane protein